MTPTTKQPAIDIDTLTGRELDAAVAEVVMGWVKAPDDFEPPEMFTRTPGNAWWIKRNGIPIVKPTLYDSPFWAREVEDEIERRGKSAKYVRLLMEELGLDHLFGGTIDGLHLFKLITATPEQRCRAAYKAVMGG